MILYICCMLCDYKFLCYCVVFFFKQKTAYEMRISDWSSDVCSSDLPTAATLAPGHGAEFMPALAELLPGLVVEFGGEGAAADARRIGLGDAEIGRASCRERVCQYVWNSVVAVSLKKNKSSATQCSISRIHHTSAISCNT